MGCNPCIGQNESELAFKIMSEDKSQSTTNSMNTSESKSSLDSIKASESTMPFPHQIESLCQISDNIIAVGAINGSISLINITKKSKLFSLKGHNGSIRTLKLLRNGHLASGSGDSTIKLWSPLNKQFIGTLIGHSSWVNNIIELRDGRLASASSDNTIRIWNMNTYQIDFTIATEGCKNCLIQTDDATILFNAGDSIQVYDLKKREELYSFPGAYSTVVSMLYLKQQDVLVSGTENGLIRAWNITTHEKVFSVKNPEKSIKSMLKISNDVIAISSGININLWSISTKTFFNTLTGHQSNINGLVLLSHNNRIVSGSDDKTVKFWN